MRVGKTSDFELGRSIARRNSLTPNALCRHVYVYPYMFLSNPVRAWLKATESKLHTCLARVRSLATRLISCIVSRLRLMRCKNAGRSQRRRLQKSAAQTPKDFASLTAGL